MGLWPALLLRPGVVTASATCSWRVALAPAVPQWVTAARERSMPISLSAHPLLKRPPLPSAQQQQLQRQWQWPRLQRLHCQVRLKTGGRRVFSTATVCRAAAGTQQRNPRLLPERLLVFHAGTPRTTFLACLKVTTLFGLAFFTFLVGPAYVFSGKPLWQVLGIAACGILPFALVAWTSAPFVAFVHLRLPPFARQMTGARVGAGATSAATTAATTSPLGRYVRHLPPTAVLDLTTMNLVGRPRIVSVALADLVPAHERLRIVNLKQVPTAPKPLTTTTSFTAKATTTSSPSPQPKTPIFHASFPWIRLPPPSRFGAPRTGSSRGTPHAWAWPEVLDVIGRRAQKVGPGAPPSSSSTAPTSPSLAAAQRKH